MRLKYRLVLFVSLLISGVFAQSGLKDSIVFVPLIGMSYSFQIPGGDMAQRFGVSSAVGLNVLIKTKKNFVFGVSGNYLFGKDIKEELFKNITTAEGNIINQNGEYAEIRLWERGFSGSFHFGKLFRGFGPNVNSGIIWTIGIGYLQHKIKIDVVDNNVPQLAGDYIKGYDKLTSGTALSEFVGYLFLSNNRILNFFAGFECIQAFTKSKRTYDFDLMARDTRSRIDLFYGFKVGWILPLYSKIPNDYYYY